jgi:hypothetical protein
VSVLSIGGVEEAPTEIEIGRVTGEVGSEDVKREREAVKEDIKEDLVSPQPRR